MALRVLLLTSEYPPLIWGGIGRYAYELARNRIEGLDLDVVNVPTYWLDLSRSSASPETIEATEGTCRVLHVVDPLYRRCFSGLPSVESYLVHARRVAKRVIAHTRPRYDAVYLQDFYNVAVGKELVASGVADRLVAACHLPLSARFSYFSKAVSDDFQQILECALTRLASRIMVPSRFAARTLGAIYNVKAEKIVVCPHGAHPGCSALRATESDETQLVQLVAVGRFTEQKGFDHLPGILRELQDRGVRYTLKLVGQGPGEAEIFERLRAAHLLEFIEHIRCADYEAMSRIFAACHIFVSVSAHETFGLSVLEAMAHGCVPVCFAVGALPELVEDGVTGFLVEPNDRAGLADRIARMARSSAEWRVHSKRCRQRAAVFTWEQHLQRLKSSILAPH